jgi:hypothetical protein
MCISNKDYQQCVRYHPLIKIPSYKDQRLLYTQTISPRYCETTFIGWQHFSWFLQNALIPGLLNSWFQTLQATINWKIVFRWIFIFVVEMAHEISKN